MNKIFIRLCVIFMTIAVFSCQKENNSLNGNKVSTQNGKINSISSLSDTKTKGSCTTTTTTCGTPLQVNLVDNYPNQYYKTYGNITISNDATNVYITLNSLTQYSFYFTTIKLDVGSLAHIQAMVPYYDYNVGPPSADYTQNFSTPVSTYTFTISRSKISGSCFYVFVWAYEVKSDNSDSHYVWVSSTTSTNSNPNSSYISYCLQNCTSGKGGDDDDDDDHDHHHHDKDHHDKDHDKDHHDNDHDKDHHDHN